MLSGARCCPAPGISRISCPLIRPWLVVGLAERLEVTASTALRMVDRLIAAGLVDRRENAQDRREVVIDLTPAGRSLVRRVTRARRTEIERVVRAMPATRRRELVRALEAFAIAADEPAVVAEAVGRRGW